MPVPFARLLKLLDSGPESFSDWALRQAQWYFKWITTALRNPRCKSGRHSRLDPRDGATVPDRRIQHAHDCGPGPATVPACRRFQRRSGRADADAIAAAGQHERLRGLRGQRDGCCARADRPGRRGSGCVAGRDQRQAPVRGRAGARAGPFTPGVLRLGRDADARANHLRGYRLRRGTRTSSGPLLSTSSSARSPGTKRVAWKSSPRTASCCR